MSLAKPASSSPRGEKEKEAPTSFAQLRAQGIEWLQSVSGQSWTDHNLHDPGITLLEQMCFALTDVAYRADFPVADHLTSKDGEIHYAALSLHPPAQAFPCRATTAADVRRVLLDAVPGLDDATLVPGEGGVVQLVLKLAQGALESPERRVALAREAFLQQRNLGEDLHPRIECMADVACHVVAQIEIGGPREAADVLAEVYNRCDRFVARAPRAQVLQERLLAGASLEQVYTGPVLRNGFIEDAPRGHDAAQRLFLSDLGRVMQDVPGVEQVRLFELRLDDGTRSSGSVPWRGEKWALRLALPERGVLPSIEVMRRGNKVDVPLAELRRKLDDLHAGDRADRARQQADQAARAAAGLPRGQHRKLHKYHSVQQLLPAIYGVGRHGVPRTAPPQAQARAQQLKTYLLLMEQVVAQGLAQLQHLRELFAVNGGSRQTVWSQMIDGDSVPGVAALLSTSSEQVGQAMVAPFDQHAQRKSLALDHLLALYGETYTQNSMRQFGGYHAPQELETLLLENKAEYLRQIVGLTRDRAGGHHPGLPLRDVTAESALDVPLDGDEKVNCSGLQRRAGLLLGLRIRHPRALTQVWQRQKLALVAEPQLRHAELRVDADLAQQGEAAGHAVQPASREDVRADLRAMPMLRGAMPQAVFRAGLWRDHYRVLPLVESQREGEEDAYGGAPADAAQRLVLGPDDQDRWWHLGDFPDIAAAQRAAASLRMYLLYLQQESEGLHVVEHVLLRPLASGRGHAALQLPADFHALRISVVLPGWTTRTCQPAFRQFAEETLRINCPAHLSLQCLWLDFEPLQAFEACWEPWLAARRQLAAAPEDVQRAELADETACRVIEHLLPCAPEPEAGEGDEPFLQGLA